MSESVHPTVFIVDDDPLVCDMLAELLASVSTQYECFASGADLLERVVQEDHGCIVLDVRLPGMGGIEVLTHLAERGIRLPVIMLSGHADVPTAVSALKHGVFEFMEKPFRAQTLLDQVWRAIEADELRLRLDTQRREQRRRLELLSSRERQILDMVAQGRPSKQIAIALDLSTKTIENHRSRIMEKTGANGVADLVRLVLEAGEEVSTHTQGSNSFSMAH